MFHTPRSSRPSPAGTPSESSVVYGGAAPAVLLAFSGVVAVTGCLLLGLLAYYDYRLIAPYTRPLLGAVLCALALRNSQHSGVAAFRRWLEPSKSASHRRLIWLLPAVGRAFSSAFLNAKKHAIYIHDDLVPFFVWIRDTARWLARHPTLQTPTPTVHPPPPVTPRQPRKEKESRQAVARGWATLLWMYTAYALWKLIPFVASYPISVLWAFGAILATVLLIDLISIVINLASRLALVRRTRIAMSQKASRGAESLVAMALVVGFTLFLFLCTFAAVAVVLAVTYYGAVGTASMGASAMEGTVVPVVEMVALRVRDTSCDQFAQYAADGVNAMSDEVRAYAVDTVAWGLDKFHGANDLLYRLNLELPSLGLTKHDSVVNSTPGTAMAPLLFDVLESANCTRLQTVLVNVFNISALSWTEMYSEGKTHLVAIVETDWQTSLERAQLAVTAIAGGLTTLFGGAFSVSLLLARVPVIFARFILDSSSEVVAWSFSSALFYATLFNLLRYEGVLADILKPFLNGPGPRRPGPRMHAVDMVEGLLMYFVQVPGLYALVTWLGVQIGGMTVGHVPLPLFGGLMSAVIGFFALFPLATPRTLVWVWALPTAILAPTWLVAFKNAAPLLFLITWAHEVEQHMQMAHVSMGGLSGGVHRFVTATSIGLGLYEFGLFGVVLGPVLLSLTFLTGRSLHHLYTSVMWSSIGAMDVIE